MWPDLGIRNIQFSTYISRKNGAVYTTLHLSIVLSGYTLWWADLLAILDSFSTIPQAIMRDGGWGWWGAIKLQDFQSTQAEHSQMVPTEAPLSFICSQIDG